MSSLTGSRSTRVPPLKTRNRVSEDEPVTDDMDTTTPAEKSPSQRSKRRGSSSGENVPSKKSKKQVPKVEIVEPQASEEEDDDESEEEENPKTTYARRIIMRNRMYRTVDDIETAQRRIEHGDDDDSAIHKAVKHYTNAEILKEEYRPIVNGRDLCIDSLLGDRLSRVLLIKAGKISSGSGKFKFADFADHVLERGSLRDFYRHDLNSIFDSGINFKSLALIDLGALPKPKKARAERVPRNKNEKGELVDVQGKKTIEVKDEKDADFSRQLDHINKTFKKILKERTTKRINYYEFVIDPTDFGTTVQNCFSVAFLLKDQEFYLEKPEGEEYPFLRKLTHQEKAAKEEVLNGAKPLPTHQFVNTFTFPKWKGLIHALGIKAAIIKPREK